MICVSIAGIAFEQCREILKNMEMAELRLDLLDFTKQQVGEIFSMHPQLVATCRPGSISAAERLELLLTAVAAGAAYVDIEVDAGAEFMDAIKAACREKNCKLIISQHDYENTPARDDLKTMVRWCFLAGADVAKIACRVNCEADAARILSLYDLDYRVSAGKKIVAIGMGEKGKITRVAAPLLGAPFTYAALCAGKETAPGQLTKHELDVLLTCLSGGKC